MQSCRSTEVEPINPKKKPQTIKSFTDSKNKKQNVKIMIARQGSVVKHLMADLQIIGSYWVYFWSKQASKILCLKLKIRMMSILINTRIEFSHNKLTITSRVGNVWIIPSTLLLLFMYWLRVWKTIQLLKLYLVKLFWHNIFC